MALADADGRTSTPASASLHRRRTESHNHWLRWRQSLATTNAHGQSSVDDPATALAQIAALVVSGAVELPIKARFPLDQVQDAYREVARRSGLGKIVLDIGTP